MATNICIPLFEEGDKLTAFATAAVTGKKFVALSGNRQANGDFSVAPPAAGGRVFGVAEYDAAIGARTGVLRERGCILPVTAAGAIAAFAEVEVDATGAIITKAAGVAVGYAVNAGVAGQDCFISLY